jgi:hypothetical protein
MAESKNAGKGDAERGKYRLELVGFQAGGQRPDMVVQAVDPKKGIVHSEKVAPDGSFSIPPDVLRTAEYVVVGAADEKGGVAADASARFRASEFASLARQGTVALAEGVWSKFLFHWECVSGSVRVCRRRPWWFDTLISAAVFPLSRLAAPARAAGFAAASGSSLAFERFHPSVNDLLIWPYRCFPVCLGTVDVYRRTCCCWPIVIDDWRISDLIRDLEIIVERLPKVPPKFPPPPPPPIDPLSTPIFKGGALNELALNAPNDLRVLRSVPSDQAAQYINSREYLLRRLCICGAPHKVATGTIQPDGTFNICWLEGLRLFRVNCHDEFAYVVKQTIGGTTTTIYDGLVAGAWFSGGGSVVLTSYNANAFSCTETGTGDGTAFVYLDLIGDTESHELTTPASTGWDRVAAPGVTSGLLFPNPTASGHLRNLGGSLELTFKFSEGMKDPAVGARFYRVSISKADSSGNPVGTRYYYGQGLHPSSDGLTWQKAVITGTGVDIVPDTLGPVSVGTENYLYRIPFDSDEAWTGSVRHHALIHTLFAAINVPGALDLVSDASNHLITLEVFNAAGERLRPLGVPASGQLGTEVAKAFKFRRWFQPGGSVGDDTVEVPFAALTHLFCWDNRAPEADITRLVENGMASDEECQFLAEPGTSTFGVEYRAYVPDERFQYRHEISWIRGLNGSAANGGVGSLPTPLSPTNVGKPPDPPENSGTNTFQLMLTRINPVPPPTVLERCSFAVTLTTQAKTTDGASFSYPYDTETAAFALQIS